MRLIAGVAAAVLSAGHVDAVAPAVESGKIVVKVKDGTQGAPAVFRDPADVLFHVKPAARRTVPAGFAFLGAPGSPIWLLPQAQSENPDVVWAGWSSETITPAQVGDPTLQWTLLAVDGPGPVQLFETGPFGEPRLFFDSSDGLPDTEPRPIGTHAHFNWVFHAPGAYTLTFAVAGKLPGGADAGSGPVRYRFCVDELSACATDAGVPAPGAPTPPPGGASPAAPKATPPALRVSRPSVRGRTLTFRARIGQRGKLDVAVKRGRRVVTRAKARTVGASSRQRTFRVRLGRTLGRGTYRVAVRLRAGGASTTRTMTLRRRATTATAARAVTLADGHVDAASARIVGGRLRFSLKDSTGRRVVWRDPASVVIRVVDRAKVKLPADRGFIGRAGQTVWMIPQVQKPGVIWSGWNTEEISSRQIRGGVTWELRKVSGPGRVVLFQTGAFGDERVLFNSDRRLPQRSVIAPGTHAHGNWAFTAKGTYRLTFTLRVTTRAGKRQSATATLVHRVG